ncbi:MAG: GPP34 family phosphoprotein [Bacteroidetes bacterium]|nr:GPP34 family phosphoprotein [Bacteroidota bacterium]
MTQIDKFNLTEKFILLAMHPDKARYKISDQALNAGLIGAILLDLTKEDKLLIKNKMLQAKSSYSKMSATHNQILSIIQQSEKERNIKIWIQKLSMKSGTYRKKILEGLRDKGLIKIEYKKFLFIPYLNAYLIKKNERINLINQIREILIYSKKPDTEMASLLGMVEACKMYPIIARDRTERKDFQKKLKEIIKSDLIASGVDQVIKEMQAAITAAVMVSTMAATSGSR